MEVRYQPQLALLRSDPALSTEVPSCPTFAIDESEEGTARQPSFLEAVLEEQGEAALPELDASANAVAIQTLKLENEGWERDYEVSEPTEPEFTEPAG